MTSNAGTDITLDAIWHQDSRKVLLPLIRLLGEFAPLTGVLHPESSKTQEHGCLEYDQLRLVFACCHPALPPEGQDDLTLRTICGLATKQIARALFVRTPTLAQRMEGIRTPVCGPLPT